MDVYVQGAQAPLQIVEAIEHINQLAQPPEVLVITRGGGSAEDLAAFSDERVVRAVAGSRIPTLVAIGHEVDESLAELAADVRASTPTNAAVALVPDRAHELSNLQIKRRGLTDGLVDLYQAQKLAVAQGGEYLTAQVIRLFEIEAERLRSMRRLAALFNPEAALRRGYAMVRKSGKIITKTAQVHRGDGLDVQLSDGTIKAVVN